MYHIYEAETQNEGVDWHIYARNYEDAYKMMLALNKRITQKCRKLMDLIHYEVIADELKAGSCCCCEKKEIEKFFSQFQKPFIKKDAVIGGYVLDYRKCSIRKTAAMPYSIMLSYLDTLRDHDFFDSVLITPVYAGHHEINIPDHDVNIKLTFGLDKKYGYGNQALLSDAGVSFIHMTYVGEDVYRCKDFFLAELINAIEFCQFLNWLPCIDIYNVTYK